MSIKDVANPVVGLCANCCGELRKDDTYEVNGELWCRACTVEMYPELNKDNDYE